MDLERSVKFMFDDDEWLKKLLIGGVLNIVPIVNFASIGWGLQAFKNVTEGQETPLPEWAEFGDYFVKGLFIFLGAVIYYLPLILFSCVIAAITGTLGSMGGRGSEAVGVTSNICLSLIGSVYGIIVGVVFPAVMTMYAVTDDFGAMFRFGEIWEYIRDNFGDYIIAVLIGVVVSIVASLVGSLACVIGLLITLPWAYLVYAHLFAQVYNESDSATVVETEVI